MIPHSRPTIEDTDIEAVVEVMRSNQIAIGPKTREFEKKMSDYLGVNDAVATSSGTAALHLALKCLDIGSGHEVIMPTGVCSALMYSIKYCGAEPVLADINITDLNISVEDVKQKITSKTGAIIVPHMYGVPANLKELKELEIPLVEDCAHSVGASYEGMKVGSFGDAAMFSFYATKMMSTGEGGMVTFKSKDAMERARCLRECTISSDYNLQYNYKMTDMEAALGISQLSRLPEFIRKRRELANSYNSEFESCPVTLPRHDGSIFYRYIMVLDKPDVDRVVTELAKQGVTGLCPVQPVHEILNLEPFKNTKKLMETAISLPIYPTLSDEEHSTVVNAFKNAVKEE